jgi:hypothetical protein
MIENLPKFEKAINGRTQKHTTMFNLCQLFKANSLFSEIIRFFLSYIPFLMRQFFVKWMIKDIISFFTCPRTLIHLTFILEMQIIY